MYNISQSVLSLIGHTPLLELQTQYKNKGIHLFAKLEMFNPTSSIKDRIALYMVSVAEERGDIKPGTTIIEASSGNTGAALAMVSKAKGYRCIVTTSEKTSVEKVSLMRALGAEVRVCPSSAKEGDANHYITLAEQLNRDISNSYLLNQYNNVDNIQAHYYTTGPEIWKQTVGNIDYLVACSSSGGTISGIAKYLKEQKSSINIVMPDPIGSIYYKYFKTGTVDTDCVQPYKVEGVGKDFLCECVDFSVIDDVVPFTDDVAFSKCRELISEHGVVAGLSSGAAYAVALQLAEMLTAPANIVVIFPDSGMKYLSKMFIS